MVGKQESDLGLRKTLEKINLNIKALFKTVAAYSLNCIITVSVIKRLPFHVNHLT